VARVSVRTQLERRLLWISLALGVVVLAAVPLHAVLRADPRVLEHEDYIGPACETPLKVLPEPVCPKLVAGESPAIVAFALVAVPLAIRRGGRGALLFVTFASVGLAALQFAAPFAFAFDPVEDASGDASPFDVELGCGLVNCGLDHTLFHVAQVPFLVAMAVTSYRATRSAVSLR
jgi:hypothetical protein